ncbi:UbiA prenyltransferase family-domain-containing protein [Fennellomyces sp. T-0311]|nr:UbiA prenyltransferase family-domain-containing protein [Fennellomyces sp. T-0311]
MRLSLAVRLTKAAVYQKPLAFRNVAQLNQSQRLVQKPIVNYIQRQWVQSTSSQSTAAAPGLVNTDDNDTKPKRIIYGSWIDRLPEKIAPYAFLARIDKPIGTWLLYWPCAWGITMATYSNDVSPWSAAFMLAAMGFGAVVMRGAGCTVNDLWDRDIDDKVARTKIRPVAAGTVTVPQAIGFTGLQLLGGLTVFLQLNTYTQILSASSLALVVTYPLMKRITYWPQLVLGLAYNTGAIVGWSSMTGSVDPYVVAPLYIGGIAWTLTYDTIYAHQDKLDDIKVGVKSTALRFGEKTPQWLTGFSSAFVGLTALAGYMNGQGLPFYLISVGGAAAHLAWQLKTVNYDDTKSCWDRFRSNHQVGAIIWSGLLADCAYAATLAA